MKVSFLTLGCKVNQYESEAIAEALEAHGFTVVPFGEVSDATVINTCAVTTEGERKARQMVRRAIHTSPNACICVTGCAAQLHPDSFSSIPGVHCVLGNGKKMQVVDAILSHFQTKQNESVCLQESFDLSSFEPMAIQKSERTRAYIKIEDGCDSRCAYCIIKTARGKVRSKPLADILKENGIICEHSDKDTCVMMLTPETATGIERLRSVLLSVKKLDPIRRVPPKKNVPVKKTSIREAVLSPTDTLPVSECLGKISGDTAVTCPPAIPITMSGEVIDSATIDLFKYYGIEKCSVLQEKNSSLHKNVYKNS